MDFISFMAYEVFIKEVLKSFITLFVIMDPLGVIPIFLNLVKGMPKRVVRNQVKKAIFVSMLVMLVFLFFGVKVLNFFNIDLMSFKIAGGIILLILSVFYVLGADVKYKKGKEYDIIVPVGVPLLVGPGTITTIIILAGANGVLSTLIAALLAIAVADIVFNSAPAIYKILGIQWTNILSRIMGMLLAAIAVDFIRDGIIEIVRMQA